MKVYRFKDDYHVNRWRLALVVTSFLYLAALNLGFVSVWLFAHGALLAVFYACKMLDISKQARRVQGKLKRSRFARWRGFLTIFEFSFYAGMPILAFSIIYSLKPEFVTLNFSEIDKSNFNWLLEQVNSNKKYSNSKLAEVINLHIFAVMLLAYFSGIISGHYARRFFVFLLPRKKEFGKIRNTNPCDANYSQVEAAIYNTILCWAFLLTMMFLFSVYMYFGFGSFAIKSLLFVIPIIYMAILSLFWFGLYKRQMKYRYNDA